MDKEKNSSQDVKNALAFVPLLAFIFYFIDQDKTERFTRNLGYAVILFIAYVIGSIVFIFFFYGIIVLVYLGFSGFLAFMAYNGKDVRIGLFDALLKSFDEKD